MDEHQLTQFLTRFKRFNHALSAFANDYYVSVYLKLLSDNVADTIIDRISEPVKSSSSGYLSRGQLIGTANGHDVRSFLQCGYF